MHKSLAGGKKKRGSSAKCRRQRARLAGLQQLYKPKTAPPCRCSETNKSKPCVWPEALCGVGKPETARALARVLMISLMVSISKSKLCVCQQPQTKQLRHAQPKGQHVLCWAGAL